MSELGRKPRLANEASLLLFVRIVGEQHLQGDLVFESLVERRVHRAHAASSELTVDAEASDLGADERPHEIRSYRARRLRTSAVTV